MGKLSKSEEYLYMLNDAELENKIFEQSLQSSNEDAIIEALFVGSAEITNQQWKALRKDIVKIIEEVYNAYIKDILNSKQYPIFFADKKTDTYTKKKNKRIEYINKKLDKIEKKGKGSIAIEEVFPIQQSKVLMTGFVSDRYYVSALSTSTFKKYNSKEFMNHPIRSRMFSTAVNGVTSSISVRIESQNITIMG